MNRPMKKKMVIHSTSPKVLWTFSRRLLAVMRPVVEQHQHRGAAHGDGRGLQMQRPRQHEGDHHDRQHHERLLEQQPVGDGFVARHRHDARLALGRGLEVRPQSRWIMIACTTITTTMTGVRWMTKALKSRPTCEPIRMLGGSPISVAVPPMLEAKISANRIRIGRHVELAGDRERHRHDQQHGGDVVEQRGEDRGGDLQQQQDAGGMRLARPAPTRSRDTGTCRSGARSTPGSSCR